MGQVSEAVTVLFAAVVIAAVGFELNRKRKQLREIYDVLDTETRHITAQLEQMVQQGALKPYEGDSWA